MRFEVVTFLVLSIFCKHLIKMTFLCRSHFKLGILWCSVMKKKTSKGSKLTFSLTCPSRSNIKGLLARGNFSLPEKKNWYNKVEFTQHPFLSVYIFFSVFSFYKNKPTSTLGCYISDNDQNFVYERWKRGLYPLNKLFFSENFCPECDSMVSVDSEIKKKCGRKTDTE